LLHEKFSAHLALRIGQVVGGDSLLRDFALANWE
jgi:hypothetical protein